MAQAWGGNQVAYVHTGRALASIDPRVVVKLPLTREGLAAAALLREDGTSLCMTCCYAAKQVLSARAVGAE